MLIASEDLGALVCPDLLAADDIWLQRLNLSKAVVLHTGENPVQAPGYDIYFKSLNRKMIRDTI